MYMYIVC